ncbi:hypothetical protein [Nostoc sp. NMS7]|nr:hypothetical protein [Nostoc sp. NMS7]
MFARGGGHVATRRMPNAECRMPNAECPITTLVVWSDAYDGA